MNALQNARLRKLESTLSLAAGVPVEITIRGERAFTWSFDGKNEAAAAALVAAATQLDDGTTADVEVADIGDGVFHTCVYVEAAQF